MRITEFRTAVASGLRVERPTISMARMSVTASHTPSTPFLPVGARPKSTRVIMPVRPRFGSGAGTWAEAAVSLPLPPAWISAAMIDAAADIPAVTMATMSSDDMPSDMAVCSLRWGRARGAEAP